MWADTGKIDGYKGRGVFLSRADLAVGTTAAEIMEGAWVLERQYEIPPYISRMIVSAILSAVRAKELS